MDTKYWVQKYIDHKKYLTSWQIAKCHSGSGSPYKYDYLDNYLIG